MRSKRSMDNPNREVKNKLSAFSLGIAFGITESIFIILFAWISAKWGYGSPIIHELANVYYGYGPSFIGGLIGGVWGFVDGFTFGLVAGLIYNLCLRCCVKSSSSE